MFLLFRDEKCKFANKYRIRKTNRIMEKVVLKLQQPHAGRMKTLINIMGNSNLLADEFIDYHINRLKREIVRMQIALNKFEVKYQMKSNIFYERLENGELGDDKDFVLWSGIYELQMDSQRELAQLA
jgi:hypothetical protein